MSTQENISAAEKNLERILSWISRLDNRFAVLLGIGSAMLGVFASIAPPFATWTCLTIWVALLFMILLIISFVFLYMANFPQTKGPSDSLLFFGSIAGYSLDDYRKKFITQGADAYLNDLLHQCHRNSEIVNQKFKRIKWAYRFLLTAILPWAITIYLFKSIPLPE